MSQSPSHSSPTAGRKKESTSNGDSQSPMVLREGGEASTSSPGMLGVGEAENHGEPKVNQPIDDGIDDRNTQESSVYHPPYYGGKKTWETHNELVILGGKERHRGKPEVLKFSNQDAPRGPFTDMPDIDKMRLWRSGTGPVSPVEVLEAATKRMIDTATDLGKKERLIRDKDRDIETIKNYLRQLKTEYEQEIHKRDAEIKTLKVSFKGSLSPLQPFYSGRSDPGAKEYEENIQKKKVEIRALKASLRESLLPAQDLSAPGTLPMKPSKPTKTTMLLEIANRTKKNLLKAHAGVHIIRASKLLRDGAYGDAHEAAFRAEKIIDDNQLERDFSYARVIFCKAQAEYCLGRLEVASELFNKARSYGIDAEDVDPWIGRCITGSESRPNSGYFDYLKDLVGSGLLRRSSVRSFDSGSNTPVRNSGPAIPCTPSRGSWLPRVDSFQIFRPRGSSVSSSATSTPTRTDRGASNVARTPTDDDPKSKRSTGTPTAMYQRSTLVSETGSPSCLDPQSSDIKHRPDLKLSDI